MSASSAAAKTAQKEQKDDSMESYACQPVTVYEKLDKIGEGTYGTVFMARDKRTGEIVALKKLRMDKEKGGFPLTSIREIKLLKSLKHPNIVELKEIVVGKKPDSIFLVFEFCENDFASILDKIPRPFSESEVKLIMIQLLSAVKYLHENFVLHRDIKLSNLLMKDGNVKLADFGLARLFGNPLRPYTPKVVTLWYRPPELLLGSETYHTAADMWAVGCVFGELLQHKPLLPGRTELEQLDLIFKLLGSPNVRIWPGFDKLNSGPVAASLTPKLPHYPYSELRHRFPNLSEAGHDLLSRLLTYDPSKRITAAKALQHPYFSEPPSPTTPNMMPRFPSLLDKHGLSSASGGLGLAAAQPLSAPAVVAAAAASRPKKIIAVGGGMKPIALPAKTSTRTESKGDGEEEVVVETVTVSLNALNQAPAAAAAAALASRRSSTSDFGKNFGISFVMGSGKKRKREDGV